MVHVLILRAAGTNCEVETARAFKIAGSDPKILRVNEVYRQKLNLMDYEIIAIPGGFSYGDDVSSGKILALELRYFLREALHRFISDGRLIIGICNGFQVLVKAGLLPAFEGPFIRQEATLAFNDIGYYHDRWVYLKCLNKNTPFTSHLKDIIELPVAHAEGKFIIGRDGLKKLERNNQIALIYVDEKGREADFPYNPNGSVRNIAGVTNPEGNIMGLMPHPERFIHPYHYPNWTRCIKEADGMKIFRSMVEYAKKKL
ncbi:phosphoribosylformylglycinamidine synthase I [Candidatus Bathyarchaeota archaeon ex4484_205]|nr:MAG: phosphoribosylformylglycinamidine synthase I [Candidatus Bathyarchaeota archaeon ex4484_205]RLG66761.1 MAG: phosphoribosylformylglycinamidine synthase I [archaeon]